MNFCYKILFLIIIALYSCNSSGYSIEKIQYSFKPLVSEVFEVTIPKELSFVKNIKMVLSHITGSNHFCIRKSVKNQYNSITFKELQVSEPSFFSFLRNIQFERSHKLIYSIWIAIIYSILTMLVAFPFILMNRNRLEKKYEINQFLKEKYQESLIEFLYNEQESEKVKDKIRSIARNDYNKQYLINEIIDLSINLKGETTLRLRNLYLDLGLEKLTFKKVQSKKWHLKIKAFRELAFMNLKDFNKEIVKSLDSKNDILRMEAQIAMVRLNEKDPFLFLDYLDKPFTLWEQMNIHELMVLHNLAIPDFSKWAKSSNKSVAIFSINMIKVFKQVETFPQIVELLDHEDSQIRRAAINTLGSFKTNEVLKPLKDHFTKETYENKIAILQALQKSTDISNIPFLKWVLENENDVFIQVDAAKGIRNIGKEGEEELESLILSEQYRNYLIILKHVLDKRI